MMKIYFWQTVQQRIQFLRKKKYFEYLILTKVNVTTISIPTDMIKCSVRANILL